MIQPNSDALANSCADKILERFGDRIVIDEVLNYYEAPIIGSLRPDLIISTIPLKYKLEIPTITISMFVNTVDEYELLKAITELDRRHYKMEFNNFIKCLILEEYYSYNLDCDTYEDVISYMCDRMYEGGRVEESAFAGKRCGRHRLRLPG